MTWLTPEKRWKEDKWQIHLILFRWNHILPNNILNSIQKNLPSGKRTLHLIPDEFHSNLQGIFPRSFHHRPGVLPQASALGNLQTSLVGRRTDTSPNDLRQMGRRNHTGAYSSGAECTFVTLPNGVLQYECVLLTDWQMKQDSCLNIQTWVSFQVYCSPFGPKENCLDLSCNILGCLKTEYAQTCFHQDDNTMNFGVHYFQTNPYWKPMTFSLRWRSATSK